MGWLKLSGHTAAKTGHLSSHEDLKSTTEHIESISIRPQQPCYSYYPKSTLNEELTLISATEVSKYTSQTKGGLWIVVDNIVYDCTTFINEHPGGEEVIRNFGGQDCSWQFWRFHGKKEMEDFGKELRIGRTEGLKNKFSEPVRWVGLRSQGMDEW